MRDMATKMAELKFEAPLAQFEETEDWGIIDFHHQNTGAATTMSSVSADNNLTSQDAKNSNNLEPLCTTTMSSNLTVTMSSPGTLDNAATLPMQLTSSSQVTPSAADTMSTLTVTSTLPHDNVSDNFTETFSGSLEDLVNTFDDKITKCFCNYDESVEKLAPVQVRTQEEIMNECQMWWTITGNFGNILPIDWSKSYARKLHMPALNLNGNTTPVSASTTAAATPTVPDGDRLDDPLEPNSEDEAVANDLDLHSLILGGGLHAAHEPPIKTADEVIREIDDMMQDADEADGCSPDGCSSVDGSCSLLDSSSAEAKAAAFLHSPLYEDKLKRLSVSELNEVYLELEVLIREFSETLIAELALRDELEYEKELKNSFISLLLSVQNRRRQYHVEKKRRTHSGLDPKYLTTVIPYHLGSGPPDNQALQVLIKILKAINEDSPTVPTLLTDYILKVLCPT